MKENEIKTDNYMDETDFQQLGISMGRLIMHFKRLERYPRQFGEAGHLTPSEVHTMEAIGCGEGLLMSELALRLGITKGAVTQMVSRLEGKELVVRATHPTDSRAVRVSLTVLGMAGYRAHEQFDQKIYERLRKKITKEEAGLLKNCFDAFYEVIRE